MDSSGQAMSNGYVLSKLAAERFVHRAFRNGFAGCGFSALACFGGTPPQAAGRQHEIHISHVFS